MEEPRRVRVDDRAKAQPKKPIERVYRMAYCGTVTLHDAEGNAIHTFATARCPSGDAAALCEALASDVLAILTQASWPARLAAQRRSARDVQPPR